ncbi:DUF4190 domain-containing protein [Cellulomonas timonensis]|uniref:DUF4190 domain-containing protein n=1 Tax=Cellulomonas timonensis TaxID=1689271 RepID=UPI00082D9AF0|nr:DUF4190 domain-containing protein [Cellulomonas timonensis]
MSDPQETTDPTRPIPAQPEGVAPAADESATPQGEAAAEGSVLVVEAAPEQESESEADVDPDVEVEADANAETPVVEDDAVVEPADATDVPDVVDASDVPAATVPVDAALATEPPPYGTPLAAQGAPAPTGTDGLAIAGLVLAFLVWPVGLGLSIAALVRTRRSGRPGKGLAIAGIVVSTLAFVATVVSTIILVTAGIALVEAEEERVAAAAEAVDAAEAAADLEAAEEAAAAAAAAESEAPAVALPPVVEGSLVLPGSVAGLTGKERGCEILFADDPNSLFAIVTSAGEQADDAMLLTVTQLMEAAKADLGAEHEADANALLAIFQPATYELAEPEMTTALTEGSAAADRLAIACEVGL